MIYVFINISLVVLQNVAPAHVPGIVIFIDAITIVYEEATKSGPPSSLPIACIEAGNDHSLPNLALRFLFFFKNLIVFCIVTCLISCCIHPRFFSYICLFHDAM